MSLSNYVTLSPFSSPLSYVSFGLDWVSSLFCIFVSLHFYRLKNGTWWLLVAFAFALPLIWQVIFCLAHGLPPFPYGCRTVEQTSPLGRVVVIKSNVNWNLLQPLMVAALAWAYLAEKGRPAPPVK